MKLLNILVLAAVVLGSCQQNSPVSSTQSEMTPWQKRAWIDKAAKTLRAGDGLGPGDAVDKLMALEPEAIVDQFMSDPRFTNTVLKFNLYFLGFAPTELILPPMGTYIPHSRYAEEAFDKPQAISAALAVRKGTDYFTLFDVNQPFYMNHLGHAFDPNPTKPEPNPPLTEQALRKKAYEVMITFHDKLPALFQPTAEGQRPDVIAGCRATSGGFGDLFTSLFAIGVPENLVFNFNTQYFRFIFKCFSDPKNIDPKELLADLATMGANLVKFSTLLDSPMVGDVYYPTNAEDVTTAKAEDYGFSNESGQTTYAGFWKPLVNSSTNYNRKRGAYVLKTFFCDDLTPINVALPENHGGDRHASDPNCQSCHYKLDPMSGFFRNRGVVGIGFKDAKFISFDDNVTLSGDQFKKYLDTWKAPANSGRTWDVGFIRSPTDPKLNSYGDNEEDLFKIIRNARETRQCLTKRMLEFYLGRGQIFDGGWADGLTKKFDLAVEELPKNPGATSAAYKAVVKTLVLSNTFKAVNPKSDQCYDFAAGAPVNALPCAVSFLVKNNCSSCHNSTLTSGGLDLTSWIKLADGTSSFKHVNGSGAQYTKGETFKMIAERLSSKDPDVLMPQQRFMDPVDRATLYKWIVSGPSEGQ